MSSVLRDQRGVTLAELLVSMAVLGLVMAAVLTVYTTGTTVGLAGENKAEAQQAARAAALMNEDLRLAGYGFAPAQSQIAGGPTAAIILGPGVAAACPAGTTPTSICFMADLLNASTTLANAANQGDTILTVTNAAGIAAGDTIFLINGGATALTVSSVLANDKKINVTTGVICPPVLSPCTYPAGSQVGRPRVIVYSWNAATQTLTKDAGDGAGPQPLATGIQAFQLTYFDASDAATANPGNIRRVAIDLTAQSVAAQNRGTFRIISAVRPRNL